MPPTELTRSNTLDIHLLLSRLKRPAFASEDDFKFVFAWEIQQLFPNSNVILEYPYTIENKKVYIDIVVRIGKQYIPIELKYKTKKSTVLLYDDEYLTLRNHSACDIGRYDFLRDVWRLEQLLKEPEKFAPCGYAVLLTNDPMYWDPEREQKKASFDRDFKLYEGDVIKDKRCWYNNDGIVENPIPRWRSLDFYGEYRMAWHNYRPQAADSTELFRYVVVPVMPNTPGK